MRNVCSAAVLFVAASTASAQYTVVPESIVVKSGDPAPSGRATPDVFSAFLGVPSVNSAGKVAFASLLVPADGVGSSITSLWTDAGGGLTISALEGTPIAPASTDPTRLWAPFSSSTTLFLADNGRLVASALGSPQFPSGTIGRYAVMGKGLGGEWSFIARNEQPLPGQPGQTYIASLGTPAVRADNGRVAFPARSSASTWHYIKEGDAGLAVVDLVPPPGVGGMTPNTSHASTGDFAYIGRYSGGTNYFVRGQVGGRGPLLVANGDTLTFLNAPGSWVVAAAGLSQPPVNDQGEFLLQCRIRDAQDAGAPQLGAALRFTPTGVVLLARQGDAIPNGGGLLWGDVSSCVPVLSDSGQSAWWTKVSGPGTGPTNDTVVVLFGGGDAPSTKILARGGAPVAELPGYTYSNILIPAMTRSGRTVYQCTVTDANGPTPAVFGVDSAGRSRLLAAGYATSIVMPSIGAVPLQNVTASGPSGGNDGIARQLTSDGRLVSSISYPGGKAVVFLSIPCPADIAGAGAAPGYDGALDNNDFIVFIGHFFNADARADYGAAGGVSGPDGLFDNNDFIAFIGQFFDGCN